ncbi:MAG: hypothetical protein JWN17_945 [Frankiales bacterium]|nr:hypothetical protein [Frankiales bacterium]
MGKVEDMRRIREQRAAAAATSRTAAPAPPRAARATTRTPAPVDADLPDAAPAAPAASGTGTDGEQLGLTDLPVEELCGHKNMGGRSCTRERDHQKTGTKNHRYG